MLQKLNNYENIITIDEKKKLLILALFLCIFFLFFIINLFIILFLKINIIYFLLCLELFYLSLIILSLTFSYFLNIPLGNIFALFLLIISALESVLGLSIVIINKFVFNSIYFKNYINNRY